MSTVEQSALENEKQMLFLQCDIEQNLNSHFIDQFVNQKSDRNDIEFIEQQQDGANQADGEEIDRR